MFWCSEDWNPSTNWIQSINRGKLCISKDCLASLAQRISIKVDEWSQRHLSNTTMITCLATCMLYYFNSLTRHEIFSFYVLHVHLRRKLPRVMKAKIGNCYSYNTVGFLLSGKKRIWSMAVWTCSRNSFVFFFYFLDIMFQFFYCLDS